MFNNPSYTEEVPYWLGLNAVPNMGPTRFFSLLKYFKSIKNLWDSSPAEIKNSGILTDYLCNELLKIKQSKFIEKEMEEINRKGIEVILFDSPLYPSSLKEIPNPPPVLYVKGNLLENDLQSISIVGARKCTNYGRTTSEQISYNLAKEGLTIISGMAYGIDTAAHKGAINAKGRTIAVLGSGMNHIYPASNKRLYQEIADSGAVISEFPLNTKPEKWNFPIRNRIIAGFSLGTLIVEAALNSGSLITASLALEYGKEVFAVPGDINNSLSKGPHKLIKSGAKLSENYEDILEEIGYKKKSYVSQISIILDEKSKVVYDLIKQGPIGINDIFNKTKFSYGEIAGITLELELKGYIKQLPGNIYICST